MDIAGFSLRILVAGERCNVTGEYFERGSMSEKNIVISYLVLVGEFCVVKGEFSELRCLMNTLILRLEGCKCLVSLLKMTLLKV